MLSMDDVMRWNRLNPQIADVSADTHTQHTNNHLGYIITSPQRRIAGLLLYQSFYLHVSFFAINAPRRQQTPCFGNDQITKYHRTTGIKHKVLEVEIEKFTLCIIKLNLLNSHRFHRKTLIWHYCCGSTYAKKERKQPPKSIRNCLRESKSAEDINLLIKKR